MKKTPFFLSLVLLAGLVWSCNNDTNESGTTGTETDTVTNADTAMGGTTGATDANTTPAAPLAAADSTFVMEAASAGVMEVTLGQMAQEKAVNPRVKMFGEMMVRDHQKANSDLKSIASQNNVMVSDSLMPKHQKHVEAMRKMDGKTFDKHYISMMTDDHKEDISKFEKASGSAHPGIKTFASAQLPVLKTHLDSAQAIKKGM